MRDTVVLRSLSTGEIAEFTRSDKADCKVQELTKALLIKDAQLEKIRAEFAEYKANKNKEKYEIVAAKRKVEGHVKKLLGKVFELNRSLKQRGDDTPPWYSELKKERDSLQAQVYNLDSENVRLREGQRVLSGIVRELTASESKIRRELVNLRARWGLTKNHRYWLYDKLTEKTNLHVSASKVIAAFEREVSKSDKNFWQTIIDNPKLPELKQYINIKEGYDAERKRKLKESYQPKHQDRASSGSTAEAGDSNSGVAGGQVQTEVKAQALNGGIYGYIRPERIASPENNSGAGPIYSQSYGRGNRCRTDHGVKDNAIEASKKSFTGILGTPKAKDVFERKYSRNFLVQGTNAAKINELLKPYGEELSPIGVAYFSSCPRAAAGAQVVGRYAAPVASEPQPVFYDAIGNRVRFDSNGDKVTKYYAD